MLARHTHSHFFFTKTIHKTCMQSFEMGWTRIVIEKPFGRDLETYRDLSRSLQQYFHEFQVYRMDHYLGKSMVQGLLALRFQNTWLEERLWNNRTIKSVYIVWKERDTLQGRGGGYFDAYGIVRDVVQNHLLQLLTLVAMERPDYTVDSIRNEKVRVLQNMSVIQPQDVLLGQYEGYGEDVKNNQSQTPTFALVACHVNTPRWKNVLFVMEAGKALDENVCEVRLQFHSSCPAMPGNELVLRIQPNPAIWMR